VVSSTTTKCISIIKEITASEIPVDKIKFAELCRTGCKVYNSKFSCPSTSPTFSYPPETSFILVILYKENDITAKQEFTKVKALNSILKATLNKLLRNYPNVYGSGSCRLCRNCNYPNVCNHPERMIYSLESVGIDVQSLCAKFGHILQWYKRGESYKYGSVVGLIRGADLRDVENRLNSIMGNDFVDIETEDIFV
jgi:predicted metal-binding protein